MMRVTSVQHHAARDEYEKKPSPGPSAAGKAPTAEGDPAAFQDDAYQRLIPLLFGVVLDFLFFIVVVFPIEVLVIVVPFLFLILVVDFFPLLVVEVVVVEFFLVIESSSSSIVIVVVVVEISSSSSSSNSSSSSPSSAWYRRVRHIPAQGILQQFIRGQDGLKSRSHFGFLLIYTVRASRLLAGDNV